LQSVFVTIDLLLFIPVLQLHCLMALFVGYISTGSGYTAHRSESTLWVMQTVTFSSTTLHSYVYFLIYDVTDVFPQRCGHGQTFRTNVLDASMITKEYVLFALTQLFGSQIGTMLIYLFRLFV